jgi:Ca-activated chloride channel family protein
MNGFTFLEPRSLAMLLGVPLLLALGLLALAMRRIALKRFFNDAAGQPWASAGSISLRVAKVVLYVIAASSLILALARPGFNPQPRKIERTGRDAIFVIDVSRSMLAQDVRPSRLERAKLGVRDVLDVAEGDRIGIVAFAGAAVLKCPLTTDYSFVRLSLDDTNPESVGRGGTAIGEAIRFASSQLAPDDASSKDGHSRTIFLITDGEDHESEPFQAAEEAAKKGIRIVTMGVGSELSGAPVPADNTQQPGRPVVANKAFVEYEGHEVVSKMDSSALKRVAEATPGGVFLNVGTGNIELDTIYKRLMKSAPATSRETTEALRYTELFQALLGLALVCMLLEGIIDVWHR